jgi:hypothetical protein
MKKKVLVLALSVVTLAVGYPSIKQVVVRPSSCLGLKSTCNCDGSGYSCCSNLCNCSGVTGTGNCQNLQ